MLSSMVLSQLDPRRLNLASYPVARAFALSLLFHALLFVILEVGHQTGFWKATLLFRKPTPRIDMQMAKRLALAKQQQREEELPLVFVEVDPTQATPEPPKDAKYYSARNSRAANPDTTQDKPLPKVEGKQERVAQTMDKAKPQQAEPLQPAPPAPPQPIAEAKPQPEPPPVEPLPEPKPELKPEPKPSVRPSDLALAKPGDEAHKEPPASKAQEAPQRPSTPPPRPRTLEAARKKSGLPGEKMKQQGGVKRFALESSFDVRSTPFGAYDAAIIAAIQSRWYDLLETRDFAASYSGKVVLEFRLNSDGRVTEMKVNENDVTEILGLLCQRAVQDPAPFAPWPADLRRLVGKEYREVRFTFYYN